MCPLGSGTIDRVVGPHVPGVTAFLGVDYRKEVMDVSQAQRVSVIFT